MISVCRYFFEPFASWSWRKELAAAAAVRVRFSIGLSISIYNTTPYKFVIDKVNYHKYTQNSDNKRVGQRPEVNSFFLSL